MSHGTGLSRKSWKRLLRDRLKDRRGQVSILVGSMTLTLLLFTTFVINVGMLVNAKINLQNAADMAAYAGAAVQARQLTQISFLNYELRRAYKKFLFRYYVMGNMAQHSHPKTLSQATGERTWTPNGAPGKRPPGMGVGPNPTAIENFKVPTTCIMMGSTDNSCQVSRINGIHVASNTVLDAIGSALHQQLLAIEKIRRNNCGTIAGTNTLVMNYWLYNTDPDLKTLAQKLGSSSQKASLDTITSLARGLGLYPKTFLVNARINTLRDYINESGKQGLNSSQVDALIQQGDAAKHERTYQAFRSAYNSLGNHTFDNDELIQMDEVLPNELVRLNSLSISFDTYVTRFGMVDKDSANDAHGGCTAKAFENAENIVGSKAMDCWSCPYPIPVKNLQIARSKDPAVLTYYAVRLQAPAKLMFNPFGADLKLRAYAAAQPFGSRIGPEMQETDFVRTDASNPATCKWATCQNKVPNLPVFEGEGAGSQAKPEQGWNTNKVLFAMFTKFKPEGVNPNTSFVQAQDSSNLARAYHAAQVPNPWEQGKYNIPIMDAPKGASVSGLANIPDAYQQNFTIGKGYMSFWAPLKSGGNLDKSELTAMFDEASRSPPPAPGVPSVNTGISPQLRDALIDGLTRYIEGLKKGENGEDNEGFNMARITDPFNTRPNDGGSAAPRQMISFVGTGAEGLLLKADAKTVKTSYVSPRDKEVSELGRIGYSVKFVPLRSLAGQGPLTTSGSNLTNPLPKSGTDGEIDLIEH